METPAYEPTPEELRERCREVQAGWDEETERRRAGRDGAGWMPPAVQSEVSEPEGE